MAVTRRDSPATETTHTGFRPLVRFWLVSFVVLQAAVTLWAMCSPIMGSPDEPAHTVKAAAVVRGQFLGPLSTDGSAQRELQVPSYLEDAHEMACYRFDPSRTASCVPTVEGDNETLVTVPSAAGGYNPLYYLVAGLPSLVFEDAKALYLMRVFGGAFAAAFLALGLTGVRAMRRGTWPAVAAAVAITPTALFLSGSVNPNGLELAAGFSLAAWLAVAADRRTASMAPLVPVALSAVALANTRSVALAWLAIIVVAFLVGPDLWRRFGRRWPFWVATAVIGLGALASAAWTLVSQSAAPGKPYWGAGEITFVRGFEWMLSKTLEDAVSYVGFLGWRDVELPATIINLWGGYMFALVVAALVFGRGWPRITLAVLTVGFVLAPPIIQGSSWYTYGLIWQGRYLLAVVLALVVTAGWVLARSGIPPLERWPRPKLVVTLVVGSLAVMHVFAYLWNLKRYVVGLEWWQTWRLMFAAPEWQPPGGWIVWAASYALLVLVVAAFLLRAWLARIPTDSPSASARDGSDDGDRIDDTDGDGRSMRSDDTPAATGDVTTTS